MVRERDRDPEPSTPACVGERADVFAGDRIDSGEHAQCASRRGEHSRGARRVLGDLLDGIAEQERTHRVVAGDDIAGVIQHVDSCVPLAGQLRCALLDGSRQPVMRFANELVDDAVGTRESTTPVTSMSPSPAARVHAGV